VERIKLKKNKQDIINTSEKNYLKDENPLKNKVCVDKVLFENENSLKTNHLSTDSNSSDFKFNKMPSDKELKKIFKKWTDSDPDKYYPTKIMKELGFERHKCKKCSRFFWATKERDKDVCGDTSCEGGYLFIGKKRNVQMSFTRVWDEFSDLFSKYGYKPIKRYPVVARWNPTVEFTIASITDFQPYVVSGEMPPPAPKLVVPQICLRFGDIDNVGVTGRHYTGFTMIGQHAFLPKEEFKQSQYFKDYLDWFIIKMGLSPNEIVIHEDSWAGGGNVGACLEFFSGGLEIGNQVYTSYEIGSNGLKDLKIKVLDMGMGQERCSWFLSGLPSSYDIIMPKALEYLKAKTGFSPDEKSSKIIEKFTPYSGLLTTDEIDDLNKVWLEISKKIKCDVNVLKDTVSKWIAINAIAEHSRTLLYALSDSALPSNVGGGYNLRTIYRRARDFIEEYKWKNVRFDELSEIHAKSLEDEYPELLESLPTVKKILSVEERKYVDSKRKKESLIPVLSENITKHIEKHANDSQKMVSLLDLYIEYYDSFGVRPEEIIECIKKRGTLNDLNKNISIISQDLIPQNFFALVSQRHEKQNKTKDKNSYDNGEDDKENNVNSTKRNVELNLPKLMDTEKLYLSDYSNVNFNAKVLYQKGEFLVLDRTAFYPTSGGQAQDVGILIDKNGIKYDVIDVFKQENVIVHKIKAKEEALLKSFRIEDMKDQKAKEGVLLKSFRIEDMKDQKAKEEVLLKSSITEEIKGQIDFERRLLLTQHHTAAHIVNGSARRVLGDHIWQAGASKSINKGRLDITHFDPLSDEEILEIERVANQIVSEKREIRKYVIPRAEAESKFGFRIYQGGAVPGTHLRIVEIEGFDVEACGGTHLNNTSEEEVIKIIGSTKIQDGIVRIEYCAGKVAKELIEKKGNIINEAIDVLDCKREQIVSRVEELFSKWKKAKKALKSTKDVDKSIFVLDSKKELNEGDEIIISKLSEILSTQNEHIVKTIKRFFEELKEIEGKFK